MHTNKPHCVPVKVRNITDQIDLRESHCNFHGINVNMIPTLRAINIETIAYNFLDVPSKILLLAYRKDTNNDMVIIKNIAFIT